MLTGTIQIDISLHAYNNYATVPALYIGCHQPTNAPSNNGVRSLNAKDQEKKRTENVFKIQFMANVKVKTHVN